MSHKNQTLYAISSDDDRHVVFHYAKPSGGTFVKRYCITFDSARRLSRLFDTFTALNLAWISLDAGYWRIWLSRRLIQMRCPRTPGWVMGAR